MDEWTLEQLKGKPWFDNDRFWTSPHNYSPAITAKLPAKVYFHDVTLRDGEQTPGVAFKADERIVIAEALSELGVQRIEAGMPIVSDDIAAGIKKLVNMNLKSEIVAFARAHKDDINASLDCGVRAIVVEHTVNPYMCRWGYDLTEEKVIDRLVSAVSMAKANGLHTTFMGWDFFRAPLEFSKKVYKAVVDQARPDALTLVDTLGVATPAAVQETFEEFRRMFPGMKLEFHVHNDFGMAVGAVLGAVLGGADGVHTAINGIGERTGNVATEEVAMALECLWGIDTGLDLSKIMYVSKAVEEISKFRLAKNKPIVGQHLFDIESGVVTHVISEMNKKGFKPVMTPYTSEMVGQSSVRFVLGKGSGKVTVLQYLEKHGVKATDEQVDIIVERVKSLGRVMKSLLSEDDFLRIVRDVLREK
ncbi:MAG: homocitrate synthase [Firmicutes bacterium]|jgi:2-isopropylmalate synthase|nr:homocitrate synthase [Bacillota bacterium]